MSQTKSVGDLLRAQIAVDPQLANKVEKHAFCADIGRKLYQERKKAGLSQKELAHRVGTKQSVISRLESADYHGYSMDTLHRISYALGLKLRLEFYAQPRTKPANPKKSRTKATPSAKRSRT